MFERNVGMTQYWQRQRNDRKISRWRVCQKMRASFTVGFFVLEMKFPMMVDTFLKQVM